MGLDKRKTFEEKEMDLLLDFEKQVLEFGKFVKKRSESHWHNGLITRLFDEINQITLSYAPPYHPYKAYCNEYEIDDEDGEYYFTAVPYYLNQNEERVGIFKYFNAGEGGPEEIDEVFFKKLIGEEAFKKVLELKEVTGYES